MKHLLFYLIVAFSSLSAKSQPVNYTPGREVIESSMFSASRDGKESAFFITSNVKKDSSCFVELVFTSQMPLSIQLSELKAGLFKSAYQSINSNRFQYLYIHRLANTGEFAKEINAAYFSRFKENPQDSMPQRWETYLKRSVLYKELNKLLESHNLVINKVDVVNARVLSEAKKLQQKEIDAEIYFYTDRKIE